MRRSRRRIRRITTQAALAGTALAVLAGCASPGPAVDARQPPTSASSPFADALAGPIDDWRTSFRASSMSFAVPGTVLAAALGDGPVALAASGDRVLGSTRMSPDDSFHIGSMTKLFTAALVMQLDQEGVLSLDDTLDRWFPEAPNGSQITVRMLLQHESGLAELDMALVGTATDQQVVDDVFARPPVAPPGTQYQYLNAGYIILGRVIEEASGRRYQDLLRSRLIEPLGLRSTYLDVSGTDVGSGTGSGSGSGSGSDDGTGTGGGTGSTAVSGYDLGCGDGLTGGDCLGRPSTAVPTSPDPSPQWTGAWSAGGMVSTARDQAVWIRALVAGDVVDDAHKAEMRALTPLSSAYYGDAYAAANLTAVQLGEGTGLTSWAVPGLGTCLGHAGSIPGSNGVAAYCPEEQLAVVILNDIDPAGLAPGYPGLVELAPAVLQALNED